MDHTRIDKGPVSQGTGNNNWIAADVQDIASTPLTGANQITVTFTGGNLGVNAWDYNISEIVPPGGATCTGLLYDTSAYNLSQDSSASISVTSGTLTQPVEFVINESLAGSTPSSPSLAEIFAGS